MTIVQPKFNFYDYPSDEQIVRIRLGSYAYNSSYLQLMYLSPVISFNLNFDGSATFKENPFWTFDADKTTHDYYISTNGFQNQVYHIGISRQGVGIIVRLILPIALLIYLSGLTFWAEYETRVDTTSTLLFSVSALYVVILQNIPLLGYLTKVDVLVLSVRHLLIVDL